MSGATEEVNVKLIKFGGTDGIEADVMIDNTTYKIKVSQDEINTAVEKSVDDLLAQEFDSDKRVEANPIGKPTNYLDGMESETKEQELDNQLISSMQELSSYLNDYKESYKVDLENYKNNMNGGSNETVNTDSNDLSIPLSVALSVLNNELKTVSPSSISTEDKTTKIKDLDKKADELDTVFDTFKLTLSMDELDSMNSTYEMVEETVSNTNDSIKDIEEFSNTYKLGEKILSKLVNIPGIEVNE